MDEINVSDYGIEQSVMSLYCNSMSTINIPKKTLLITRTKHLDKRYHFIWELVEKDIVALKYIPIETQLANIFTKPLNT